MKKWIVGIDEVGRGPIAGPVAICVCAMPQSEYEKSKWLGLTDSKKLTKLARENWYQEAIKMQSAGKVVFSLTYRTNKFIDKNGISVAILECIKEGLIKINLNPKSCIVLLDGSLKAPVEYKNQKTVIKGDQKHKIISLSSVIAKVSRDKKMELFHKKYPKYNWKGNKGYGTKEHYSLIYQHGLSDLHRKTYLTNL